MTNEEAIKELEEDKALYMPDWQKIREEIASYKDDKLIHAERNEIVDIVLEIIDRHLKEVGE